MRKARLARACAGALALPFLLGVGGGAIGGAIGTERASAAEPFYTVGFGARDLRLGNRGADVKTLNWVLRSQRLSTLHHGTFYDQTYRAARAVQQSAALQPNGVVDRWTRKAIARRMLIQRATWYGPGLWGNRTACGHKLKKRTVGVAHRKLPCGTKVVFAHQGRWVRAKVIDRGPFRRGVRWDLTRKLAKKLGVLRKGKPKLKVGVAP